MKKKSYLNRFIALVMAVVMMISIMVIDNRFGIKADSGTELEIEAELETTDSAEDVSDCIYIDNSTSLPTIKISLTIATPSDASAALIGSEKVTYSVDNGTEKELTLDANDNCYYVTLSSEGTYKFTVTYGTGSKSITKTVKFVASDSPDVQIDTNNTKIETASGETVYSTDTWCKKMTALGITASDRNTFIKSATVTSGSDTVFSNNAVNSVSYDFSDALSAINRLSSGKYTLSFNTVSFLGTEKTTTLSLWIDNEGPGITIKDGTGNITGSYSISDSSTESIVISASDDCSGVSETTVSVDGIQVTPVSSSYTLAASSYFTTVGTHTVSITSKDALGNETNKTLTVTVYSTDIDTSITSNQTGSTDLSGTMTYINKNNVTVTYVASAYGITDSDVTATVQDAKGNAVTANVTFGTNEVTYTYSITEEGEYSFSFTAANPYDNTVTKTDSLTLICDTEAPSITTVSFNDYVNYKDGVYYYDTYPTVKFETTDNYALAGYKVTDSSGATIIDKSGCYTSVEKSSASETLTLKSGISENVVYTVTFYSYDKAGNSAEKGTFKFAVDTEAPSAPVITTNVASWNKSNVSFTVSANDNLCLYKMEAVATCDGKSLATQSKTDFTGTSGTATFSYSTAGSYKVTIYAYDAAGNKSSTTCNFVIDKTSPTITFTGIPSDGIYNNNGKNPITINVSDDYGISSSDVVITLHMETYDGTKKDVVYSGTNKNSYTVTKTLNSCTVIDGKPMKYYFTVSASDESGNTSSKTSATFYYDNTAPELTISPDISGSGKVYYNSTVKFTIKVTEQFKLGATVYVIDATDYKSCKSESDYEKKAYNKFDLKNSLSSSFTQTVSKEGTYNWVIVAVDAFGNEKVIKNINFILDKESPIAEFDGIPDNGLSDGTDVEVVITDNEEIDASSFTITEYYRYYDETEYTSEILTIEKVDANTLSATVYCGEKNNKACAYYFVVTGKDRAGNEVEYNSSDAKLKVDATAPDITITPLPEATNDGYYNSTVKFKITVTEQFNKKTKVTITDLNKATNNDDDEVYTFSSTEGTFTVKRSSQGIYRLKITVEDAFGNVSKETVKFVIDKTEPEISISNVDKLNNSNVSLKVNVSDNYKGKSYRVHVVRKNSSGKTVYDDDYLNKKWSTTSVSPTLTFTDEGDYEVTVYSEDKAGNEAKVDSVSFRIDKTAPVLSITGVDDTQTSDCTATLSVNEAFAFTYDESSLAGTDITATITKKTDGKSETTVTTLNTSSFSSGNPHTTSYTFSEDGEYTITFSAKDLAGNTATTVTKTFKIDKTAPEILVSAVNSTDTEISEYDVIGGSASSSADYVNMKVTINETFFAGDDVTIKVTKDGTDVSNQYFTNFNNNSSSSIGTHKFEEDGVYTIYISAEDALGNKADDYSMVFTIDNTPPTIEATEKMTSFTNKATNNGDMLLNSEDFADILNMGYDALWTVNDTSVFEVSVKLDGVDFVDFSDLTDGYHTMTITVIDELGHEASEEFSFTYDGTAPRIIISGVEDGDVVREAFTMTISLEDEDDIITEIRINGETIDPELYEATNTLEYQVEELGSYEVVVFAEDTAGNQASTYNSDTEEYFSFQLKGEISVVFIVIIIVLIILLLLAIILLIRRKKNNQAK